MRWTLTQLAQRFDLKVDGEGATPIEAVCSLSPGRPGALAFLGDARYASKLAETAASAVLLREADRSRFGGPVLISANPAVAFASIAVLFDRSREFAAGVHPRAVVAASATLGAGCGIDACAVIEDDVEIGAGTAIGPGCVIRRGARIGPGSRLEANVYIGSACVLGARALIGPGAVIGGRGFGFARTDHGWQETPQLGRVVIGDDVEIGANTCIDRGALDDTVLENGVKLDNQIHIGHNCHIGEHTAVAACVGMSGSTRIGKRCMIGGACGVGGHLRIADDVVIVGFTMVTKSLPVAGTYGSGMPVAPAQEWRRQVARVRRLHRLEQKIKRIEAALKLAPADGDEERESD
jgi:UDP-3-O-[3-hydroxymyristoyl] glucosamine N-acyltransferase